MKKIITLAIVGILVVGGAGFYGGMLYGKGLNKSTDRFAGQGFPNGGSGMIVRGNGVQSGGMVNGEVIAQDEKSITVKGRDGGSKIVFVSGTTEIGKMVQGSLADLAVGTQVTVLGTANADGSITAQSVQLRPEVQRVSP